ncbi:hypothetical protein ACFY0B_25240 [Streptomyces sp. NPDC001797]|uniref:Squalene cyclase C-terminal domain-containing protein n=1 Tax=Streptomyces sp. 900105755 TaxID=3154389 RepID=A0ABV1TW70_9ACTN
MSDATAGKPEGAAVPAGAATGYDPRPPVWRPGRGVEALSGAYRQLFEVVAARSGPVSARFSPIGEFTVPGDPDSTACALTAAHHAGIPIPLHPGIEKLYNPGTGCYRTFMLERDGSLSTNIHMVELLNLTGEHERRDTVLQWLHEKIVTNGNCHCKWHISLMYALGEAARVLASISTTTALDIRAKAVERLLELQHQDGGWGVLDSTVEETAYAALGICAAADTHNELSTLNSAHKFLRSADMDLAPRWIGETLYCLEPLVPSLHQTALTRIRQVLREPKSTTP